MSLGMIARADNGGLGSLCWEFARHLRPEKILIVFGKILARGVADPSRYEGLGEVRVAGGWPDELDAGWLASCDTVYSAETWYGIGANLNQWSRLVLHAMPEMHDPFEPWDLLLTPTSYRLDLVPGAEVLPIPVARDRLPRRAGWSRRIYHPSAGAFHDRNGTDLVTAAAKLMRSRATVSIRSTERRPVVRPAFGAPRARVEWLGAHDGPYWECIPPDAGVFVMPRRFAGSSLPMQEAASLGLPIVTLDLEPQRGWLPERALVPAHVRERAVHMKGGLVDVYTCSPGDLAARLDLVLSNAGVWGELADASDWWASTISWDALLPEYERLLR